MTMFTGEMLRAPRLRFDYSSPSAQDFNARRGLKNYGPYDSNLLGKDCIRAGVIFAQPCSREKDTLISGLTLGRDGFSGFNGLFRLPLKVEHLCGIRTEDTGEVQQAANTLVAQHGDLDIVFIVIQSRNEPVYRVAKRILLGNGIPNQVVTAEKLRDSSQAPWVLENLALACYAKTGGTPWVIASQSKKRELVIGISRTLDDSGQFVVGFVTLFTQDGDFLLLSSSAPVLEWERDKYSVGLTQLIIDTYHEYECAQGTPEVITLHLCRRPGQLREVEAAENALQDLNVSIPYALLHVNDDTSYRLFDTAHSSYVPATGVRVDLGARNALLFLDGRIGDKPRYRRGVPNLFNVILDKRSTISYDEFPRLTEQVFNFCRINWRGFNASAVPVTLNYSHLIARLIVEIGARNWNDVISNGRLRDKAWFL
jgi:hypothetical protein